VTVRIAKNSFVSNGVATSDYRPTAVYSLGAYHPALERGTFTYYDIEAMRRDPQCQIGLRILRAPVYRAEWEVKCKNAKAAQWADATLKRFWSTDLEKALRMLEWGSAGGEVVYRIDNDTGLVEYVELRDMHLFDMRALQQHGRHVGIKIVQNNRRLFAPRFAWWVNEQEYSGLFGRPRLAGAFEPWMELRGKKGAIDIRRGWFFKNVYRSLIMRHPLGTVMIEGREMSCQQYARQIIEEVESGAGFALPSTTDENGNDQWRIDDPKINGDGTVLLEYPKQLNQEIWTGMGIQPEVVQASETGSGWSGRSVPFTVFLTSEDQIVDSCMKGWKRNALDHMMLANFNVGPDDYAIEVKSLVPTDEDQKGPDGQSPGMGQPGKPGGQPPQAGQPYRGPRGGVGTVGAGGKVQYGGGTQLSMNGTLRDAIQEAADNVDTDPTDAQKESGTFRKGHVRIQGLPIAIENPVGSIRRGKSKEGKEWSIKVGTHYGYIKKTESDADGDHIDVFIGPEPESELVFVVDQVKKDGTFDEHKCLIGFTTMADAKEGYLANYSPGWKGCGDITAMTMDDFKEWISTGDTKNPFAAQCAQLSQADEWFDLPDEAFSDGVRVWDGAKLSVDASGHEHRGTGEGGGQFVSGGGGSSASKKESESKAKVKGEVTTINEYRAEHKRIKSEWAKDVWDEVQKKWDNGETVQFNTMTRTSPVSPKNRAAMKFQNGMIYAARGKRWDSLDGQAIETLAHNVGVKAPEYPDRPEVEDVEEKAAYEMTRDEYAMTSSDPIIREARRKGHKEEVEIAMEYGDVPDRVLADYPDLAAKYAAKKKDTNAS